MLSGITTYGEYLKAIELGEAGEIFFGAKSYKAYLYNKRIYFKIGLTPYIIKIEDLEGD